MPRLPHTFGVGRRGLLLSGAAAVGLEPLALGAARAHAHGQPSPAAAGIEWLDYDPRRPLQRERGSETWCICRARLGRDLISRHKPRVPSRTFSPPQRLQQ